MKFYHIRSVRCCDNLKFDWKFINIEIVTQTYLKLIN